MDLVDLVSADEDSVSDFCDLFSQLRQGWWFSMTGSALQTPPWNQVVIPSQSLA